MLWRSRRNKRFESEEEELNLKAQYKKFFMLHSEEEKESKKNSLVKFYAPCNSIKTSSPFCVYFSRFYSPRRVFSQREGRECWLLWDFCISEFQFNSAVFHSLRTSDTQELIEKVIKCWFLKGFFIRLDVLIKQELSSHFSFLKHNKTSHFFVEFSTSSIFLPSFNLSSSSE